MVRSTSLDAVAGMVLRRRAFLAGAVGAALVSMTRGAGAAATDATLVVGMARDFATFDPSAATTSTALSANLLIFEKLYETSWADRVTRPQLASGDPVKVSDTVYQISFATNRTFHNGAALTAEDVAFSINRVRSSAFYNQFILFIKSAKAAGDGVVEIELDYAVEPSLLVDRLGVVGIVPASIGTDAANAEAFGANPVGSGPYKFTSALTNDKVMLDRFDAYAGPTPGAFKSISMRVMTDAAARVAALTVGEVALIEEPADLDIDTLKAEPEVQVQLSPGFLSSFLMFNCAKAPFDDLRVRQALMYAIDRDELVNVALLGNGVQADALLPQHHPLYKTPSQTYAYDPAKAKALLAEAGYPDGLKIEGRTFTCQTYLTGWNEAAANLIVAKWRDIGFDIEQNVGGEAIYSGIADGSYDLAIAITDQSWFGWDAALLYQWFFGDFWSKQLNFWSGAGRDQVVASLQAVLHAGAPVADTIAAVQETISAEVPMAILFHRAAPTAWRSDLAKGVLPLQTAGLDLRPVTA